MNHKANKNAKKLPRKRGYFARIISITSKSEMLITDDFLLESRLCGNYDAKRE